MTDREVIKAALDFLNDLPEWLDYERCSALQDSLEAALARPEQEPFEIDWPEYHDLGMGCGLEDRNITDRYDAMRYGWDEAIDAVARIIPEKLYTLPQTESLVISEGHQKSPQDKRMDLLVKAKILDENGEYLPEFFREETIRKNKDRQK